MHFADSIRTATSLNKPLPIDAGGVQSMILPEIKIEEINLNQTSQINDVSQLPSRKKWSNEQESVILTPDSTNYLIIAARKDSFELPKLEKQASLSFDYFLKSASQQNQDSSSLNSNILSPDEQTSIINNTYSSLKQEGFSGVKPKLKIHQDSTFVLVLVCFILIVYATKTEGNKIVSKIKNMLSNNTVSREQTALSFIAGSCLILQTVLISSLLLFNMLSVKYPVYQDSNILTISAITGLFLLFIGFKISAYHLLKFVFSNTERVLVMKQKYLTGFQLLGIAIFLPTLFYIYTESSPLILFSIIGIFVLFERSIAIYHIVFNFLQEKINFLFLIVYLCTIEILPYFILYEIVIFVYQLDLTSILWH